MMKIGILTYFKEYSNLGTNMQAYCTLKAIQRAFPEARVELVDYSGWNHGMRPYVSDMSFRSLVNDLRRFVKYNDFFKNELVFSPARLVSSDVTRSIDFIKRQGYDAIYVGSDTVLELKRADAEGLTAYWLDETVDGLKFLIAASSLNVAYDGLTESQKVKIRKTIDGYSLLGVRDDATFRLLSHFTPAGDPRLRLIPDPTFTYEIDCGPAERYMSRKKLPFNKPVVCLHLTKHTSWAREFADHLRQAGFCVASLRPARYADLILTDMSPFEQMGIYRSFELVVTHRFHDAIFSLMNGTPVMVYPEYVADVTIHGENKNLTLMRSFQLEKSNYIENKDTISAASLAERYPEAIRAMRDKRDAVRDIVRRHKESYESFVDESKNICLGPDEEKQAA